MTDVVFVLKQGRKPNKEYLHSPCVAFMWISIISTLSYKVNVGLASLCCPNHPDSLILACAGAWIWPMLEFFGPDDWHFKMIN